MVKIDMEMPETCVECPLLYDCVVCRAADKKIDFDVFTYKRMDWCPLIEEKSNA